MPKSSNEGKQMVGRLKNKYEALPQIAKASLWFFLCSFFQKGISTITVPIFTRLLSTEEYGSYNVFNSWYSILAVFITLNLYGGMYTQGLVKNSADRTKYISSMQGLLFSLILLWTVIYIAFHSIINGITGLTTPQMLFMLCMMWTTGIYNFWAVEQRVNLNYKQLVFLTVVVTILKPFVGVFLVVNSNDKVTARIFGLVVVEFVCYIGLFINHLKKGRAFFCGKYWRKAFYVCIPLVPHYLSQVVLNSADRIMIGKMVGEGEAGIYSLAYSVSTIMVLVNTVLLQTIEPWILQKIKERKMNEISSISYMVLGIVILTNILVMAFSPEIIAIFAPENYGDAIWVIPPITMSLLFMFAYNLFAEFEFYYEKTSIISFATICGALINIILNYIFIRMFGYIAAGYTTLLCYMLYAIFHYIGMRYVCKKENIENPYDTKKLIVISLIYIGFGVLFLISYTNIWIRILIIATIVIGAVLLNRKIVSAIRQLISIRKRNK